MKKEFPDFKFIGSHKGTRTGRDYYLFTVDDRPISYKIYAYCLSSGKSKDPDLAGCVVLDVDLNETTPFDYLFLPERFKRKRYILTSSFAVPPFNTYHDDDPKATKFKHDGLGNRFFGLAILRLKKYGGLHIVRYTDEGLQWMKKKFDAFGYLPVEIRDVTKMHYSENNFKEWCYYDYGPSPKIHKFLYK